MPPRTPIAATPWLASDVLDLVLPLSLGMTRASHRLSDLRGRPIAAVLVKYEAGHAATATLWVVRVQKGAHRVRDLLRVAEKQVVAPTWNCHELRA